MSCTRCTTNSCITEESILEASLSLYGKNDSKLSEHLWKENINEQTGYPENRKDEK